MKKASYTLMILDLILCITGIIIFPIFACDFYLAFQGSDGMEAVALAIPGVVIFIMFIGLAITCIPTLIFNIIGIYKLKKADKKDKLIAISILLIIFGNPIAGILMLCMKDESLGQFH